MKTNESIRHSNNGFTLVELMVSIALGIVVIGVVVSLSIIAAQNFAAAANYVSLDDKSRSALNRISREIRNATDLTGFSMANPQFLYFTNSANHTTASITCDTNTGSLMLDTTKDGSMTLLTGCDYFSFQLYSRAPIITATNIGFYLSTNSSGNLDPKFCKVINLQWKCYRKIRGSKLNTEVAQSAQVVLRNHVSH